MDLVTPPSTGSNWTDLSGYGNHGTLVGTPTYVSTLGGGYTTGSGQYISTNYNVSNNFTISIVAKLNASSFWATLWGNDSYSSNYGYLAYFLSSTGINIGPPSSSQYYAFTGVSTVHFYDFVFSGTSLTVYQDGVSLGTTTISLPNALATGGLYFGARHNNAGTSYTDVCPGTYYNMRVYRRPLLASEISSIYNGMKATYGL